MTNRKSSSPILSALVLALASSSVIQAQTLVAPAPAPSTPTYTTPAATGPTATGVATTAAVKHTAPYTVVKGDSLTSIARKFNTTRKKLRDLNNLPTSVTTVKPGDILQVPASASKTAAAKAKAKHDYAMAQPVQDFDVPASTFASCPVPLPTPGDDAAPAPAATPDSESTTDSAEKPAPIAKLVSPTEMAAADQQAPEVEIITPTTPRPSSAVPTPKVAMSLKPLPPLAQPSVASVTSIAPAPSGMANPKYSSYSARPAPAPFNPPSPHLTSRGLNPNANPSLNSNSGAMQTASANDWGTRFFQQARMLGNQGLEYDDDWRPPGEAKSWVMDCSNTSRYLYKVTAGIQLPRTASDQYYYLHLQGKAWDVPLNSQGFVDTEYLRQNLKPGDLLFWENTYRPERQPPITHVMVYLGTNEKGQWIMAGSQSSRGGEHNRRNGGPDIYVFRPSQPCGGYTTWLGMVRHTGRFCAFGRPLEADPTKLSVAANE
jgi:cell wall-associated NlpC family hydrolase